MQTQVRFFGSAAVQDDDGQIQPDRMPFAKFSLSALMGSVHSTSAEQARSDGFRGTLSSLALFGWFLAIFLGEYFAVPTATPSQPLVTGLPGCKTLARAYSEAENVATVKSLVITALVGAFFVLPALGLSVVPAHHETLEDSAREVRAFLAVSILALAATAATACSFLAAETQSDGTAALEEVQVRPTGGDAKRRRRRGVGIASPACIRRSPLPGTHHPLLRALSTCSRIFLGNRQRRRTRAIRCRRNSSAGAGGVPGAAAMSACGGGEKRRRRGVRIVTTPCIHQRCW